MYDLCKEDLRINFHTMRTGIFYGSTTGMTESLAAKIAARTGVAQTDVRNVADASADEAEGYDLLLLGSSTWGCGELQDDWYDFLDALKRKALSGKRVALFGCGDSASYPDSFCDALAEIRDGLEATAAPSSERWTLRSTTVAPRASAATGRSSGWRSTTGRRRRSTTPAWRSGSPPSDSEIEILMSADDFNRHTDLKMLLHHIYEFQKGVRRLVLCTICPTCARLMAERLQARRIDYLVQPVTADKVNLYFGHRACLDAVRMFVHKPLNELSAEEDFMLGVMLGYDLPMQCERYCTRKRRPLPAVGAGG